MKGYILGLMILTGLLSAKAVPDSRALLGYLHQEQGWELLGADGDRPIEITDSRGLNLHAVRISQVVDIEPDFLIDMIRKPSIAGLFEDVLSGACRRHAEGKI